MRREILETMTEDYKLACDLFDENNHLLLAKGVCLNQKNINHLLRNGYRTVFIENDPHRVDPNPILTTDFYLKAIKVIKLAFIDFKILMQLREGEQTPKNRHKLIKALEVRDLHMDRLVQLTDKVIDLSRGSYTQKIDFFRPKNLYLYNIQHALNTGLIALLIGLNQSMNKNELRSLFLSSILCEMGNLTIPEEILLKSEGLTDEEFHVVKGHCRDAYTEVGSCTELNYIIKIICLEHHEKIDGSGYPNGLTGENINPLARILTIADTFDALISDRSYRLGHSHIKALNILSSLAGIHYDTHYMDVLKDLIVPYPLGSLVSVNQRIRGIVVDYSSNHKPIIQVINNHGSPIRIDMSDYPQLTLET